MSDMTPEKAQALLDAGPNQLLRFGEVMGLARAYIAQAAEAEVERMRAERDKLRREGSPADHALVDRYRNLKTGVFKFPDDVAAIVRALDAAEAEVARLKEWADVVSWLDNGEKTLFDWCTGGADANGEFHRIGLRREMPDGTVLYRSYTADGYWHRAALGDAG